MAIRLSQWIFSASGFTLERPLHVNVKASPGCIREDREQQWRATIVVESLGGRCSAILHRSRRHTDRRVDDRGGCGGKSARRPLYGRRGSHATAVATSSRQGGVGLRICEESWRADGSDRRLFFRKSWRHRWIAS